MKTPQENHLGIYLLFGFIMYSIILIGSYGSYGVSQFWTLVGAQWILHTILAALYIVSLPLFLAWLTEKKEIGWVVVTLLTFLLWSVALATLFNQSILVW